MESEFPHEFVHQVASADIESVKDIVDLVALREDICHMCNSVHPRMERETSGRKSGFSEIFGWYVRQRSFAYGLPTKTLKLTAISESLLEQIPQDVLDTLDEEIRENIDEKTERFIQLDRKRRERESTMEAVKRDEDREIRNAYHNQRIDLDRARELTDRLREKFQFNNVLQEHEKLELEKLRTELNGVQKRILVAAENEVRTAFGFHEKGDRWIHETILFKLIESRYGDEYTLRRHYRPDWLGGLELDIFIDEAELGIEYQGEQHYEPIDHWGGQKAFNEQKKRDRKKRKLCDENDVELVEIRYDESISSSLIETRIGPKLGM